MSRHEYLRELGRFIIQKHKEGGAQKDAGTYSLSLAVKYRHSFDRICDWKVKKLINSVMNRPVLE